MALGALVVLLVAFPARARDQVQGVFEGSAGYTDNTQSTPENPPPGIDSPHADLFGIVSPGIVYAIETPSQLHRFSYTYALSLFFRDSDATSSTNRLEYSSIFETSPHSQLILGATAMQAHQHTAGTLTTSANTLTNAAIPGTGAFLGASLEQGFILEFAHDWRATQATGFALYTPIRSDVDAPSTYAPSARLGLERLFEWNAVGAEARAEYSFVKDAVGPHGEPIGNQEQVIGTGLFRWRHDWGMWISSRAEAGAVEVWRLNTGKTYVGPVGGAALAYTREDAEGALEYSHLVTTNVLLAQTILADEVRLHGTLPLHKKPDAFVGASAAYSNGRIIDENGDLATDLDVLLLDFTVGYEPEDELLLALRYQHIDQVGADVPPLPLSFVRNTVMLTARFTIPREEDMPRRYRAPLRVDGTDTVRALGAPDRMERR